MADLRQFAQWAARAREEPALAPDVAPAVMRRLRRMRPEEPPVPGLWMWAASGAAAAAAVVCGVIGYCAWAEMNAPWHPWLQEFSDWWAL